MLQTMVGGRLPHPIREFHRQYGPVVRVAPDELSFCIPQAWHEIYHRRDFHRPLQWRGKPPGSDADSLIQADALTHARLRNAFSPAFSERAVRGYEASIKSHIDLLLQKLHAEASGPSHSIDLVKWINFCLFDISMDIGWGASFDCLRSGSYHPWVTATQGFKALIIGVCLTYYEPLGSFAIRNMPKEASDSLDMVLGIARKNVEDRLKKDTGKQDIFANTLGRQQDLAGAGLTQEEMVANSMNYVLAGSESVTTVLSGAFRYLIQSPACLKTVTNEVRAAFTNAQEITGPSTKELKYLDAVLREAMRLCPTIPDGMRREVPEDGIIICGQAVPKHTVVSVPTWTIFTSADYWQEPERFLPERWLKAPVLGGGLSEKDFGKDDKEAYHPFSYGPRNCIGTTLAWEEMRIVMARLLHEFDLSAAPGKDVAAWGTQEIYWVWDKVPLEVQLKSART